MALQGAGDAPTEAYLNDLARLSVKPMADGWVCLCCGHRNNPVDNLLFKLPRLNCSNTNIVCDGKCPGTPEWSISDYIINNVSTNFLIRDQGLYPTSAAHAVLSGMETSMRIHGAIRQRIISQPLMIVDLLEKYQVKHRESLGCEGDDDESLGCEGDDDEGKTSRTPRLLQIAELEGVEYKEHASDYDMAVTSFQDSLYSSYLMLTWKSLCQIYCLS